MPVGRPTDYNESMLLKAQEYLSWAQDTVDAHGKTSVRIPKAEGMALFLGVNRSTLYEWARVHEDFSHILERMNQIQADRVIDKALSGEYNAHIAKLLLGKHGYSDKQEIDHTSKGEKIDNSDAIKDLTAKINELHRGTSEPGDGKPAGTVGDKA